MQGSIIGAGRLSFRVRDGTGRFPAAVAAVTLFNYAATGLWVNNNLLGGVIWWWGVVCVDLWVWLRARCAVFCVLIYTQLVVFWCV